MEADNFNNSQKEIRHKERMLRSSKSRSMTPVVKSSSNNEETSAADKNEVSSTRLSTGRKVVTSSTKSVTKTKTVGGKSSMTVVVEKNSSQEKSTAFPKDILVNDESVTRLTAKNDNMELRSEKQKPSRHSNRFVANGTGREETFTKTSVNKTAQNQNRTARMRTSDYSSDDEEVLHDGSQMHDSQSQRVLNVYQGDFWNKLPKTDFTYSPVSKDHYREVAPGVTVKPNMSRSTYQHHSAATSTPYVSPPRGAKVTTSTTTLTTTRRSRFFDAGKAGTRVPAYIAQDYAPLDSDEDEVDTRVRAEAAAASSSATSYFATFYSAVWTVVTTCWTTTVETTRRAFGLRNDELEDAAYSTPVRGQRTVRSRWATLLDYVYLLPAYVTSADLTLLSSTAPEGGGPKRLRLFSALVLLLLLLLCGWWLLYYLGLEESVSNTPMLLSHAQTTARAWMGTLGEWCRTLGGWIFLPFAARQTTTQQEEWTVTVPPPPPLAMTMATPPMSPPTAPSLPLDIDALVDRLLASDRFHNLLASRLDRPVEAALTGGRFDEWISSKIEGRAPDVDSLAAGVWESGRLQGSVQAYLAERMSTHADSVETLRAGLTRELHDKSQHFEVHNAKVAAEITRLRQEFEQKLNASVAEMKAKLGGELSNNEEMIRAQEEEIRLLKIQLVKCCNNKPIPWEDIDAHVLRYVAGVYGVGGSEGVDRAELRAMVGDMFIGRQQFEAALANVTAQHRAEMREVSEQSAQTMMDAISARISDELATHAGTSGSFTLGVGEGGSLTDGRVLEIVNRAIMTYDADKTGMVDYALESSGGSVISTRCTESYYKHSASMTLFGIPYWYPVNTPRTVIQPGVHPGECWAFRGSQGFLVIQLAGLVRISSFSVEHIPRSLAFSGNIDSAPRDFSVWGLEAENDLEPTELGKYTYLKNSTSLQYFLVARSDVQPFKIIELRIDSNHGNLEYTCLYRFRVHGTWVSY